MASGGERYVAVAVMIARPKRTGNSGVNVARLDPLQSQQQTRNTSPRHGSLSGSRLASPEDRTGLDDLQEKILCRSSSTSSAILRSTCFSVFARMVVSCVPARGNKPLRLVGCRPTWRNHGKAHENH